jgi:hypothetical protein
MGGAEKVWGLGSGGALRGGGLGWGVCGGGGEGGGDDSHMGLWLWACGSSAQSVDPLAPTHPMKGRVPGDRGGEVCEIECMR